MTVLERDHDDPGDCAEGRWAEAFIFLTSVDCLVIGPIMCSQTGCQLSRPKRDRTRAPAQIRHTRTAVTHAATSIWKDMPGRWRRRR